MVRIRHHFGRIAHSPTARVTLALAALTAFGADPDAACQLAGLIVFAGAMWPSPGDGPAPTIGSDHADADTPRSIHRRARGVLVDSDSPRAGSAARAHRRSANRPQHGPERWAMEGGTLTGLVAPADVLREGAHATALHLLHEAAHVLCWHRGIKDTTMRGIYHNQRYLAAAQEVGLAWPAGQQRVEGRGYVGTVLSRHTRDRLAGDIATLQPAIDQMLPYLTMPNTETQRTDRLILQCACVPPRKMRMSQKVHAKGPVICSVCSEEFQVSSSAALGDVPPTEE